MKKVKNIILIILGGVVTFIFLWFFFFIALPVLIILGAIIFILFTISKMDLFKRLKKKLYKKKDKIKEAIIIDER